jgi:RNA polymerase-binding transcription factor DksA
MVGARPPMTDNGPVEGPDPVEQDQARPEGGRPLDLDVLAVAERELADVEHALRRLDQGTWGACEACGAAIDPDQLARDPAARACAGHG